MGEIDSKTEKIHVMEEHMHSAQLVYPTAAAPVLLTSGGGAWTLGAFATVVPALAIGAAFDLHWIILSNPSANEDYEIVLYYGATDIECARVSFTRNNVFVNSISIPLQTIIMPADSRIRGKMMDGTGGATAEVKVLYHTY